jgi:hypothetical protein
MSSDELLLQLRQGVEIPRNTQELIDWCDSELISKKQSGTEQDLLVLWVLRSCFEVFNAYLSTFVLLKEKKYQEAWRELEKIEITITGILQNYEDSESYPLLTKIDKICRRYQALFPYRLFVSPEILILKEECSICGSDLNPFSGCAHVVGQVYKGEMCCCIVTDAKLLSVSIVEHPVQKYSVMFDDIDNPEKYPLLEYLMPRLPHAFIPWEYEITTRFHPHSEYKTGRNDSCPCLSGKKYKHCCLLDKRGVKYPHYEFIGPDEYFEKTT